MEVPLVVQGQSPGRGLGTKYPEADYLLQIILCTTIYPVCCQLSMIFSIQQLYKRWKVQVGGPNPSTPMDQSLLWVDKPGWYWVR